MDLGLSAEQHQLVGSFANLLAKTSSSERVRAAALAGGRIEHALRFSLGTTIYAGTSEVPRNIIAQRRCGLPRA